MAAPQLVVRLRPDVSQLEMLPRILGDIPKGVESVIAGALNETVKRSRTRLARDIRDESGLKYGHVLKQLKIRKATIGSPSGRVAPRYEAVLTIQDKRFPLTEYGRAYQTAAGVSYELGKEGRKVMPRAFIRRGRNSGKRLSLIRSLDSNGQMVGRYPLVTVRGPSIGHVFQGERFEAAASNAFTGAADYMAERIDDLTGVIINRGWAVRPRSFRRSSANVGAF